MQCYSIPILLISDLNLFPLSYEFLKYFPLSLLLRFGVAALIHNASFAYATETKWCESTVKILHHWSNERDVDTRVWCSNSSTKRCFDLFHSNCVIHQHLLLIISNKLFKQFQMQCTVKIYTLSNRTEQQYVWSIYLMEIECPKNTRTHNTHIRTRNSHTPRHSSEI